MDPQDNGHEQEEDQKRAGVTTSFDTWETHGKGLRTKGTGENQPVRSSSVWSDEKPRLQSTAQNCSKRVQLDKELNNSTTVQLRITKACRNICADIVLSYTRYEVTSCFWSAFT